MINLQTTFSKCACARCILSYAYGFAYGLAQFHFDLGVMKRKTSNVGRVVETDPKKKCRALVDRVFAQRPSIERETVQREVERRHIVVESEPPFAKRARDANQRKRSQTILCRLGSERWRKHRHLDAIGRRQMYISHF